MQDAGAFVQSFAIQVPAWAVLIILAVVVFGAWKLVERIWTSLSN
jgi:Sec-independent protein translocase protein TatA